MTDDTPPDVLGVRAQAWRLLRRGVPWDEAFQSVVQLRVQPAFRDAYAIELAFLAGDTEREGRIARFVHCWTTDRDRVGVPGALMTLQCESAALPTDELSEVVAHLREVRIRPMLLPRPCVVVHDNGPEDALRQAKRILRRVERTTIWEAEYELQIAAWPASLALRWNNKLPTEWTELGDIVARLQELARGRTEWLCAGELGSGIRRKIERPPLR